MVTGRGSDEAVIWYCHYRLRKLLAEGKKQKDLAKKGDVPRSAVSHLLKHAKGVGSTTGAGFAKIFDFGTRGQLTDAADLWWATDAARDYARREWDNIARARSIEKSNDVDESGEHATVKKSRPKTA